MPNNIMSNEKLLEFLQSDNPQKIESGLLKSEVRKAYLFALAKHNGQVRANGEPYINHPITVLKFVMEYNQDRNVMQAALLHDVLEDTKTKTLELRKNFGQKTTALVQELTLPRLLKRKNKALYLSKKVLTMSDNALLLKLCDRYANVLTLDNFNEYHASKVDFETREIMYSLLENRKLNEAQEELVEKIYIALEK